MNSSVPSAASLGALLVALAGLMMPAAGVSQVLYKWVDADGKVQYSDRPPKDAKGVTRIEPDTAPTPSPAPPAAPKAAADPKAPAARLQDPAGKRRAVRNELEQRLQQARDNLDTARKALAEASSPEPEERQIVQQQMKAGKGGGMHGLSLARSNCRPTTDKNGKAGVMCAASMPNEAYYERIAKLEEAVRNAEEELSQAEQAWRRGVD